MGAAVGRREDDVFKISKHQNIIIGKNKKQICLMGVEEKMVI